MAEERRSSNEPQELNSTHSPDSTDCLGLWYRQRETFGRPLVPRIKAKKVAGQCLRGQPGQVANHCISALLILVVGKQEFVEVFMREMHSVFPNMVRVAIRCSNTLITLTLCCSVQIIQFEDFHTTLAFPLLANHRDRYPCFNDDIQGTGAVVLAGAIRAFAMTKIPLKDQRILFFGAGSSGVGVAETICKHFEKQGMTEDEARSKFWLVDSRVSVDIYIVLSFFADRRLFLYSQGLVANNRGDELPEHKRYLARRESDAPRLKTLQEVVEHVKPTALLGLSTVGGTFTPEILARMTDFNARPIVFALSNPVAQAECTFEEAVEGTKGRVLYASGSPFDVVSYENKKYEPGQGNNMVS